jgi:hypothetical protein
MRAAKKLLPASNLSRMHACLFLAVDGIHVLGQMISEPVGKSNPRS